MEELHVNEIIEERQDDKLMVELQDINLVV